GVWANATPWLRPAANTIARACLVNTDALDDDARAIGDAKAERRRVLHVAGLADDDVHVGIRVARAGVVDSQRGGRSIPDRDRAVRAALGLDDVEQQAIDGHGIGPEHDLLRVEDGVGGPRGRAHG